MCKNKYCIAGWIKLYGDGPEKLPCPECRPGAYIELGHIDCLRIGNREPVSDVEHVTKGVNKCLQMGS